MKRIKNLQQLLEQKKKLKQREKDAQEKMQASWNDLKTSMQPKNIASSILGSLLPFSVNGAGEKKPSTVAQAAMVFGTGYLAKKLLSFVEKKLEKIFNKQK